ncbi:MAG: hydantoinase B/oxoprolinase family protein [Halobacteriales archaeon]|nr:hydantoinase B/oxoprolinase family protein [Halobacteriales archaeon]
MAQEIGPEHVHGLFRKIIDAAESGARARISSWTDGVYKSVAFVGTTGHDETLLKVALSVHKKGDSIHLDFTGTSPECDGSYNTYGHGVAAFLATYIYPYVFYDLPVSTGTLAPFTFEVPDGSLLNAGPEKSVCNCVYLGRSVISLCFDAFTRLLYSTDPTRAVAAPSAHSGGGSFKGINNIGWPISESFSFTLNTDGQGARHDKDGMNAHGFFYSPWGKTNNLEDFEEHGIFLGLTRRHFNDAHGFGKYRGGVGTQNVNVVLSGPVEVTSRGKGSRIPHDNGVFGGYASTSLPGISIIGSDALDLLENGIDFPVSVRDLVVDKSISDDYRFERINRSNRTIDKGDIWITLSSGGGGFGDPIERDPEDVLSDFNKHFISEWTAKNVYHVCIRDGILDLNETSKLREGALKSRLSRGTSYDTFSNTWSKQSPPIPVSTF